VGGGVMEIAIQCLAHGDTDIRKDAVLVLRGAEYVLRRTTKLSSNSKSFRNHVQLLHHFEVIRNSMRNPHGATTEMFGVLAPLPRVVAVFLAMTFPVLQKPDHALFKTVAKYLVARSALRTDEIPMRDELLHSGAFQHAADHRRWFFQILRRARDTDTLSGRRAAKLVGQHVLPIAGSEELCNTGIWKEIVEMLTTGNLKSAHEMGVWAWLAEQSRNDLHAFQHDNIESIARRASPRQKQAVQSIAALVGLCGQLAQVRVEQACFDAHIIEAVSNCRRGLAHYLGDAATPPADALLDDLMSTALPLANLRNI